MHKPWDAERRLFLSEEMPSWVYPIRYLGYEEVGEVTEVGDEVLDISPGMQVFCTWNHRTFAVVPADYARQRVMPPGARPI